MAILSAYSTPQEFKQPYPLGSAMKNPDKFTGSVYFYHIPEDMELNIPMFNVTFEPCSRSNWHRHSGGQILIATAGIGYYQLVSNLELQLVKINNSIDIINRNLVVTAGMDDKTVIVPDSTILERSLPIEEEQWRQREAEANSSGKI